MNCLLLQDKFKDSVYSIKIASEKVKFTIDLQRFADKDSPTGQKSEDATPKRRQEARSKGQVGKSQDLNSIIVLIVGFLGLRFLGGYIFGSLKEFITFMYQNLSMNLLDGGATILGEMTLFVAVMIMLPYFMLIGAAAVLINVLQVGFLFTATPLKLDITKLNPVSGFKRLFKPEAFFKLGKALVKLVVVSVMPAITIRNNISVLSNLGFMDIEVAIPVVIDIANRLALQMMIILFIMALVDYVYQKHKYEESLKMSKYDVKQERKQQEGDPKIKSKQRQKMRQMLMQSMKQQVPEADVVITNPIHLAVAIKYDPTHPDYNAPWVVAKGAGKMAENIKKIAWENNVPVRENKPLAQSLYKTCEIGDEIPEELFKVVAEVILMVSSLRNKYSGQKLQ